MFNSDDLKCLDPAYFNIIAIDDYDVTIMSRNTGHYWYIHNCEWPDAGSVVVFHIIRTLWLYELSALKPLIFKDFGNKKFA